MERDCEGWFSPRFHLTHLQHLFGEIVEPTFSLRMSDSEPKLHKAVKYSFIADEFASPDVLWRLTLILLSLPASFNWQVSLEIVWIADYQVLSSASISKLWSSMYF